MTLLEQTNRLLNNRPHWLTLKQISKATDLNYGWLKAFARGEINEPSVNKVQTLNDHLLKQIKSIKHSKPV